LKERRDEMKQRIATLKTKTKETEIRVRVNLDGSGACSASTGTRFLDHMMAAFSTHSLIDLHVTARGDLAHHVIEDTALALGKAISKALSTRRGITRFGNACVPMDESLACVSVDLVRRTWFVQKGVEFKRNYIEDIAREDLVHFFRSFCTSLDCTMHINVVYGANDHHKAEACFKALALSLRQAISRDSAPRRVIPSSKGSM
jgi:imidazoleglycerol-phosphate dehydratase